MTATHNSSTHLRGISWFVTGIAFNASMVALGKFVRADISAFQAIFFANALALVWMLPWLFRHGLTIVYTKKTPWFILRSILEVAGWFCMYTAIVMIPLPVFISLTFMTTLFIALAGAFIFRESTTYHSWIALVLGFVGVLIILRPNFFGYLEGALLMLAAATCFCCCGILIKRLVTSEPPALIVFYMLLFTSLIAAVPASFHWQPVEQSHLIWLLAFGGSHAAHQYSIPKSFSYAPLTMLMPFAYLNLIFSSVVAYIFFGELVSLWTILGGLVILGSAIYAYYIARRFPSAMRVQ